MKKKPIRCMMRTDRPEFAVGRGPLQCDLPRRHVGAHSAGYNTDYYEKRTIFWQVSRTRKQA